MQQQDTAVSESSVPMPWEQAKPLIISELQAQIQGVEIADHRPAVGFLGFRAPLVPGQPKQSCELQNCHNLADSIPVINKLTALIKLIQENPFIAHSYSSYHVEGKTSAIHRSTLTLILRAAGREKVWSCNLNPSCTTDEQGNFVFLGRPIQEQYDGALVQFQQEIEAQIASEARVALERQAYSERLQLRRAVNDAERAAIQASSAQQVIQMTQEQEASMADARVHIQQSRVMSQPLRTFSAVGAISGDMGRVLSGQASVPRNARVPQYGSAFRHMSQPIAGQASAFPPPYVAIAPQASAAQAPEVAPEAVEESSAANAAPDHSVRFFDAVPAPSPKPASDSAAPEADPSMRF